jgi:hypothetical protein
MFHGDNENKFQGLNLQNKRNEEMDRYNSTCCHKIKRELFFPVHFFTKIISSSSSPSLSMSSKAAAAAAADVDALLSKLPPSSAAMDAASLNQLISKQSTKVALQAKK